MTNKLYVGFTKNVERPSGGFLLMDDEVPDVPKARIFDPQKYCFNPLKNIDYGKAGELAELLCTIAPQGENTLTVRNGKRALLKALLDAKSVDNQQQLRAGTASIFGTVRHDHPKLRWNHVEPLRGLLADHMHGRTTAGTVGVFRRDRHIEARQMGGKRTAIGAALVAKRSCRRRVLLVIGGLVAGNGLLDILVATLTLDDIDWRAGEMMVRAKGRQRARMPIPPDVGAAVVAYLRNGRPKSSCRRLFVRTLAPYVGFASGCAITMIAKTALDRVGIEDCAHRGAHIFRHSLATELLRSGATLSEIGQLLRHESHDTTRIYAKVDIEALRTLSLPWPGGAQ